MDPWEEPVRGGYPHPSFVALSGMERNHRFFEFAPPPPLHHLCGVRPSEFSVGEASAIMPASGWLLSPQGRIPMGVVAILADVVFGTAFGGTLPPGGTYTTAELSLTRLSNPVIGGNLTAHGRLIHSTESIALLDARVFDAEGRLAAAGTSRLAVFPPPAELPEIPHPPPLPTLVDAETLDIPTPDPYERPPGGAVLEAAVWEKHSGLEILEAQARGDLPLPPISRLTGMRVRAVSSGRAEVVLPATHWLASPLGTVQGGVTAMLADTALQCAMQTTAEAGDRFAPLDVKVNFLRPVLPDGELLTAVGEVSHRGRSLAIAHAEVVNGDGKKVAMATGSSAFAAADLL